MRWKMPNVAVVAVATAAALFLVTAETVLDAGGGGNRGGVGVGGGGGGGGGGERQRDAATAAANGQEDSDSDDELEQTSAPQTPVQCGANCANHEEIKSLSIELIKASILKKLGMQQPPEFSDRSRPKVPTDLPPLQDLINKYNKEHDNPVVMPLRHMRHQSHHDASGDGGYDMQSDEATGYAAAIAAAAVQMENNNNSGDAGSGGGDDENEDDDEDDYHVRTHKLIAFAQPHPTVQKVRGHNLLYFTFSEQTGQHRITQAILWVYRKRVDIIVDDAVVIIDVHRINQMTMHQTFVATIKHVVNSTEATWVSIDLQKRMFKATDRAKNLTLMVHAYYSNKNTTHAKTPFVTDARKKDDMTKVPYLEVHTEYNRRSRSKRNVMGIDCDETSTESKCCRYPLTVDFEEFGWDWIIAPKRYTANYCSGECPLVFLQKYPHTYLAQLANQTTRVYPGTGPCCAPRKLSAISMLYFDQDYNIIYGLLPGMVADRCGCS